MLKLFFYRFITDFILINFYLNVFWLIFIFKNIFLSILIFAFFSTFLFYNFWIVLQTEHFCEFSCGIFNLFWIFHFLGLLWTYLCSVRVWGRRIFVYQLWAEHRHSARCWRQGSHIRYLLGHHFHLYPKNTKTPEKKQTQKTQFTYCT